MKKIFLYFSVLISGLVFLGNSNNPPNGYTGAPGDGICSNCHSTGSGIDGSVTISGLPSTINANTTYTITVTVENISGAAKGGFQLVALDQSNSNIGTFSSPGTSSTLQTSGSRTYWEHNPAKSFGGPGTITYTASWKSPSTSTGQSITMYVASVLANGNGNNSGDLIKQDQVSGMMSGGTPPLSASITAFKNITCNGGADGSITVTASNGTPPYIYSWSDGQNTATATGLSAKLYTVTVTDNAAGQIIQNKLLTEPNAINITMTGKKELYCFGDKDGSATSNATGGTGTLRYQWSTGSTSKTISGLSAGTYTVTVTDNSNCTTSQTVDIMQPEILMSNLSNTMDPVCSGERTGSATITVSGGTPAYIYKWSSGESTSAIMNKPAGTYTSTVTDKNGCSKTTSVILKNSDKERPVFHHWRDTISSRCDIIARTPLVTDNCQITDLTQLEGINSGQTFPPGTTIMRYKAADSNGNTAEYSYTVTINNPLNLYIDSLTYDTCTGPVNYIRIQMNNRNGLSYGFYFDTTLISSHDTAYSYINSMHSPSDSAISIKDSFGCTADTIVRIVDRGPLITLDSVYIRDASDCNESDGVLSLFLNGKISSSGLINGKGDTLAGPSNWNLPAGTYTAFAGTADPDDNTACIFAFGPYVIKCTTLSVSADANNIQVYPNPADQQTIVTSNASVPYKGILTDLSGQIWLTMEIQPGRNIIECDGIAQGTYNLILQNRLNTLRYRIVIIR